MQVLQPNFCRSRPLLIIIAHRPRRTDTLSALLPDNIDSVAIATWYCHCRVTKRQQHLLDGRPLTLDQNLPGTKAKSGKTRALTPELDREFRGTAASHARTDGAKLRKMLGYAPQLLLVAERTHPSGFVQKDEKVGWRDVKRKMHMWK